MTASLPGPGGAPAGELDDAGRALLASIDRIAQSPPAAGDRYATAQALVREQGRAWTPAPLPADLEPYRGVPGFCYEFAAQLADTVPELVYVEGYACPLPGLDWATPHAWAGRLADGAVLDPTWPTVGTAYYGIPLTTSYRQSMPPRPFHGATSLLVEMLPRSVRQEGLPAGAVATSTSSEE